MNVVAHPPQVLEASFYHQNLNTQPTPVYAGGAMAGWGVIKQPQSIISRILNHESWILDPRTWAQASKSNIWDPASRTL